MNGRRGACSHCLSPEVICSTDQRQYKGNKSLDRHSSDQMSFRHAHQLHRRTFLLASGRVSDVWRLNSSTKLPRPPKLSLCVFHPLPLFRCSSIFHSLRFSSFSFVPVFVSSSLLSVSFLFLFPFSSSIKGWRNPRHGSRNNHLAEVDPSRRLYEARAS